MLLVEHINYLELGTWNEWMASYAFPSALCAFRSFMIAHHQIKKDPMSPPVRPFTQSKWNRMQVIRCRLSTWVIDGRSQQINWLSMVYELFTNDKFMLCTFPNVCWCMMWSTFAQLIQSLTEKYGSKFYLLHCCCVFPFPFDNWNMIERSAL